ncbi:sialate O-acetylesterase [Salegentibacter holothuriorum]|uniref:Sialate O-acetylesterase n=1 Tax=Salegentibacter holothuriorum TaxID=241145 RepID=A0A1T5DHC9_9FLAO|nr:sialate O-acetylesterase [Salegentibacter holothuriorum]SKB71076.1 sialate O-acetylesterase [Salegentibacter holothuriorum]
MKKIFQTLLILSFFPAFAQLQIADVFTDNMMLQREKPIRVWGAGNPGEKIRVNFLDETAKTSVKTDSSWQVVLKKHKATTKPNSLVVQSFQEKIIIKNIIIGDVWLLIGQSNMEWPMQAEMHYEEAKKEAKNRNLRFFNPNYIGKNFYGSAYDKHQLKNLSNNILFQKTKWEESDSSSFKNMSAVGYYFGRDIISAENIPIGLINLAIGGAPAETFIDAEALIKNKKFSSKVNGNWLENDALPVWIRERGMQNIGHSQGTNNHAYKPGFAFKTGIKPILKMPIKGILWYQGESNAQELARVKEYPELQKLMIKDYRKQWKNKNLAFYWVQLSSIDTTNYDSHFWPEFRNGQRRLLGEMDHVGMAVSSDVGNKNDIHPRNKKAVGKRLARWALKNEYGKDIIVSGPLPQKAEYKNGNIIVEFKYTGKGLQTLDGKAVRGFSIDGKTELTGEIKDKKIVFPSAEKPEYIYYNWQPYTIGNLGNSEGLPASTFKMEVIESD